MSRHTRILRWLLVACGVLTLLALPAVFLPRATMDEFHRGLGLGELLGRGGCRLRRFGCGA